MVEIIKQYGVVSVVHLAGLKSVSESELNREAYYINNVKGTESILKAMSISQSDNIVFASTAGVYKYCENKNTYNEKCEISPASVYGQTKIECESSLSRFALNNTNASAIALRFFNVGGAIESTLREEGGENVFPAILAALREGKAFQIFGLDYPTADGSAIRDYIHILDLVDAILLTLENQLLGSLKGFKTINLGTSQGTSVLELVSVFEQVFDLKIDTVVSPRREGDVPYLLADSTYAKECLGWNPTHRFIDIATSYLD